MKHFERKDNIWIKLQKEKRPVFLYGTGNGADKILDVCKRFSIEIEGVFASSGFVRNRTFRSMPVQSIEAIEEKYGDDFVVLLAFGTTLESVCENIKGIAAKHILYIPEVPLYGNDLFTYEYYETHLCEIEKVYDLLSDEISKQVFEDMIAFRLTGEGEYLSNVENIEDTYEYFFGDLKSPRIVDFGAYKGDSTATLAEKLLPSEIIAVEPDFKTFAKLSAYAENENKTTVIPVNAAVGGECSRAEFMLSQSRGSGKEGISRSAKCREVDVITVDSLLSDKAADLLKFDVEGDEWEAITGGDEFIRKHKPNMAISVYHRTEDIFALPIRIHAMIPEAKLYMRRVPCIPAWDITLIVKK